MNVIRLIATCCFLLVSFGLAAQPAMLPNKKISFDHLPEGTGLSESSINDILQDSHGYLWVATWSGLIRYDGYESRVFHAGNGNHDLKGNLISCLFEDHSGNLWIGTHMTGMFRYDRMSEQFFHYSHDPADEHSLSNNNVWKIIEDSGNNLWVATEHGLNRLAKDDHRFVRFNHDPSNINSLSANFVTDIAPGQHSELWIGSENGINMITEAADGTFRITRFADASDAAPDNFVYRIILPDGTSSNEVWFITKKGLKHLVNGIVTEYTAKDKASGFSLFRSLLFVKGNEPFFVLGSSLGLSFFDLNSKTFSGHVSNRDLSSLLQETSMAVTSLYIDRGGVLWVGTKKGLYKHDSYRNDIGLFATSSFDPTNSIITGIQTAPGGYWISTIGGGVFHFDNRTIKPVPLNVKDKQEFAPFVQAIHTDMKGNVWVGTAGAGVMMFNGKQAFKEKAITIRQHFHVNAPTPISDDYIVSFAEDNSGDIWAGTWDGYLIRIKQDGTRYQFPRELFGKFPLVSLLADGNDLWIATRGNGLFRFNFQSGRVVRHFRQSKNHDNVIPSDFTNAVYKGSSDLFIATDQGVGIYDNGNDEFVALTQLESTAIVSVVEDNNGRLWLATWRGISVLPVAGSSDKTVRSFDHHDLIQGGFYYNNVCLKDAEGTLFFGGSNGLNVINPSGIGTSPNHFKPVITGLRLFGELINHNNTAGERRLLRVPVPFTENVELRHDENTLSFEFSALDFSAPGKISYSFMLDGVDPVWHITTAARRFANYTDLRPGTYTFKLKSTNSDGIWSDQVREIRVVILPPWYKTTAAYAGYFLFFVVLLLGFRKLILMRASLKHDLKVERLERENIERLNQAKLQFFTNVSHELRTPLTLMIGPAHELIDDAALSNKSATNAQLIERQAQRMLRLVNELLDFRKADSGSLQLRIIETDMVRFTGEVMESFRALAEQMDISYTLSSANVRNQRLYVDPVQMEKVLFNLLSNAFKHTARGGVVAVDIREQVDSMVLSVSNTGDGIRPEHADRIFDAFFSFDDTRNHSGTGIGLALVKLIVEAHHGTVTMENKPGLTVFDVEMLKGCRQFSAVEMEGTSDSGSPVSTPDNYDASSNDTGHIPSSQLRESPKLLIVDDNPDLRSFVRSLFDNDFDIYEAEDGAKALLVARELNPELIITDVMMPVMDGISLCSAVKSDVLISHIGIILLTARAAFDLKMQGFEHGADDYVTKPFHPKLLRLKVRNLLRSRNLLRQHLQSQEPVPENGLKISPLDQTLLDKLRAYVVANMAADISVDDVCLEVGMSRMQLYRKLKALTGQSANELIRAIRLREAARLLKDGQYTVGEVTFAVGFNDLQYFRECFKKMFHVTPTEYAQGRRASVTNH